MKFLLPLLGLLLVAGAHAQRDVDVEGLREVLQSLVNNGKPITAETLTSIATSFTGVEKDGLTTYINMLQNAREAEELVLQDDVLDVTTFSDLLFNLKALGVNPQPKLAEALLGVIDGSSLRAITPIVNQWKQANSVALTDALKSSLDSAIKSMTEVIAGTTGNLRERLRAKINSLPAGLAKSILAGIEEDLTKISQVQGGFSFSAEEEILLPVSEVKAGLSQVNKVLNRAIVKFLASSMNTMSKAQVKEQVQILLRKLYDSKELPTVLEAVLQAVN